MLRPLSGALAGWQPGRSAGASEDPVAFLTERWSEIVGADVARHSMPSQIVGDALLVVTRSGAWSQQLTFLEERILQAVLMRFPNARIARLRFRVGPLNARAQARPPAARPRVPMPAAPAGVNRRPSVSAEAAIARFRSDVIERERAKRSAGWKECSGCGALIAPGFKARCAACASTAADDRDRRVARFLYDTPFLGYAGAAAVVEDLAPAEYEAIRRRTLRRWWEILARAGREGRLSRGGREPLLAGSYVLLKSGLRPEHVTPAILRNELGDDIYTLIYGTETASGTNVQ